MYVSLNTNTSFIFIKALEHKHAEEPRDIVVQELGAAHIVTDIVLFETTWVKLGVKEHTLRGTQWNCFMLMSGVERKLTR